MNRIGWGVWAVLATAGVSRADYVPTEISWPGWRVASSENLFLGRSHTSYPLTHLFDGKPETAWVFSGNRPQRLKDPKQADSLTLPQEGRFILTIRPDKPVEMDSLRLLNGYARSRDLYEKNSRASELLVTVNGDNCVGVGVSDAGKPRAVKAALRDTTDWQAVAFPRAAVAVLTIEITGVRKGRVDDLCVSELELWCGGRKIEMAMPGVVRFTRGDDCGCGCTWSMIRRDGTPIVSDDTGEMGDEMSVEQAVPSADGRRIAGVSVRPKDNVKTLWVVNTETGGLLLSRPLPKGAYQSIQWKGPAVSIQPADGKKPPLLFPLPHAPTRPAPPRP